MYLYMFSDKDVDVVALDITFSSFEHFWKTKTEKLHSKFLCLSFFLVDCVCKCHIYIYIFEMCVHALTFEII